MRINRMMLVALSATFLLAGCEPERAQTNKTTQAQKAADAAQSIHFDENAEIDNIKRRLELTADPGKVGFIVLLNQAGQPILYEGVKGKVTSGGKRLTTPDRVTYHTGEHNTFLVRAAPSDEGTWGSSGEYIYYWNTDGVYRQWAGVYLYSDQPVRLRIEPLVITATNAAAK